MNNYFVKREMYRPWNFRYLSPNEITEDLFKLELRAFFPGCKFFDNDEIIYTVVQFYNKNLDMTGSCYTIYFIKETEKVCVLMGNLAEKNFSYPSRSSFSQLSRSRRIFFSTFLAMFFS